MIGSVILPGTTPEQWPEIRREIRGRIERTLGTAPAGARTKASAWKEIERYEKHGLTHLKLTYHVVDDHWHEGIIVMPEGLGKRASAPAVLCIHGTSQEEGKYSLLDPDGNPRRAYGIELARRGYVTMAVDQLGFGAQSGGKTYNQVYEEFYKEYPDWTVDDRHLLDHQRALDVLSKLDFVRGDSLGCIGNSLGGRGVMYLTAMDERIRAAVSSTGISPHFNNTRRGKEGPSLPLVKLTQFDPARPVQRVLWDYHELIALCAPRALLALEAHNDHCNPNVWPATQCFFQASAVYKLLGHPERLTMVTHGEGHDTPDDLREFAYVWLDRFLKQTQ